MAYVRGVRAVLSCVAWCVLLSCVLCVCVLGAVLCLACVWSVRGVRMSIITKYVLFLC